MCLGPNFYFSHRHTLTTVGTSTYLGNINYFDSCKAAPDENQTLHFLDDRYCESTQKYRDIFELFLLECLNFM